MNVLQIIRAEVFERLKSDTVKLPQKFGCDWSVGKHDTFELISITHNRIPIINVYFGLYGDATIAVSPCMEPSKTGVIIFDICDPEFTVESVVHEVDLMIQSYELRQRQHQQQYRRQRKLW